MIIPRVCEKLANARFLLFWYIAPNKHLAQFAEISAERQKFENHRRSRKSYSGVAQAAPDFFIFGGESR
jgi:hypothetical protein